MADQVNLPKPPRTVLVAVTALDAGIVVVQPMGDGASPRVLQGPEAHALHELALDPTLPPASSTPVATGFSERLLGLAEKLMTDGSSGG